jgi:acetolactate synthase-1/2/3 large subunit
MFSVTGSAVSVARVEDLPAALSAAWSDLYAPRRRPIYLGIPHDLLGRQCPVIPELPGPPPALAPGGSEVDAAAEILSRAARPVIVLGGGAVDAGREAATLARTLDAPIALTGNAKGAVPSSDALNLGATLPFEPTRRIISEADAVLLVGTQLSDVDIIYAGKPLSFRGDVVRVDVDRAQLGAGTKPTVGIVADAALTLAGLNLRLTGLRRHAGGERSSAVVQAALENLNWTEQSREHLPWVAALDGGLPPERIVALDSTQLAYTALHALPAEHPRSWLAPYGFGTLGPALPMGIGAKVARPDAPVVVIAGDGGFLFTVAELATAVDRRLSLAVVVWDNGGFGEIRDSFQRAGIDAIGCDVSSGDIAAIAAGFGCAAVSVGSPDELRQAVARSLEEDRPTVIRVAA